MAKKTKSDVLKCPIDYLYLWASDAFISKLGSKAKIIKQKKYHQYQALYKAVTENEKADSAAEYLTYYNKWIDEIAAAIKDTYGYTPAEILTRLALGQEVVGKNFSKGVFGVGETPSANFVQDTNYSVNPVTGQILANGVAPVNQTPIYGNSGQISGYSYVVGGVQYQSSYENGQFVALSYSTDSSVQTANGKSFDFSKATFWQNANNYMPMIDKILSWVTSIVNSFFPNRTVLTTENTVPQQTEWVYEKKEDSADGTGLLLAGGMLAVGLLVGSKKGAKDSKKKK